MEQPPTPQPDYSFGQAAGERLQRKTVDAEIGEDSDVEKILPDVGKHRNFISQPTFQPSYFAAGMKSIYDEQIADAATKDSEGNSPEVDETSGMEAAKQSPSGSESTANEPFEFGQVFHRFSRGRSEKLILDFKLFLIVCHWWFFSWSISDG